MFIGKEHINTLQATLCGQSEPKPSGGEIFLNKVITSRCLIEPLNETTAKAHVEQHKGRYSNNIGWREVNGTCRQKRGIDRYWNGDDMRTIENTLHAVRWGQNFPNPNGGVMLRRRFTTSRCFIRPLREGNGRKNQSKSSRRRETEARSGRHLLGVGIVF